MKSMLIVDETPDVCIECPFMRHGICYAYSGGRRMNDEEYFDCDETKPYWCPLKPIPEKKIEDVTMKLCDILFALDEVMK